MTVRDQHLCEFCGEEIPSTGISIYAAEKCKNNVIVPVRFNHLHGSEVKMCWDFCDISHLTKWLKSFVEKKNDKD